MGHPQSGQSKAGLTLSPYFSTETGQIETDLTRSAFCRKSSNGDVDNGWKRLSCVMNGAVGFSKGVSLDFGLRKLKRVRVEMRGGEGSLARDGRQAGCIGRSEEGPARTDRAIVLALRIIVMSCKVEVMNEFVEADDHDNPKSECGKSCGGLSGVRDGLVNIDAFWYCQMAKMQSWRYANECH